MFFLTLYSHDTERCFFLGGKTMINLHSVLKSRGITLPTMVHIVEFMAFPLVTHGCDRWSTEAAEHWRTDAFNLWCQRRLSSIPWTTKEIKPVHLKGNQLWIFIGKTDVEVEAPILWAHDTKNQIIRKDWCREWLRARGEGGNRMRWLDVMADSMDMSLSKLREIVKNRKAWCAVFKGSQSQTRLSDWITTESCFTLKYLRLLSMKLIVTTLYFRKECVKS